MQNISEAKAERILSIYSRLKQGKIVFKAEVSAVYGVSQRTIQRDIADIQCFLQNQGIETGEIQEIVFDKQAGGYRLQTRQKNHLDGKEILAAGKVLLESRALMKSEMFPIINRLIGLCSDDEDVKTTQSLLNNEMRHYVELHHGQLLLDKIWDLEQAVKDQKYVEIQYKKLKNQEMVMRKIKPVGIMFSEFYFYLTAYIEDIDKEMFRNPDDTYPTIYRIDRIAEYRIIDEHFRVPYADRFEEGEFRKRVQFMYGGKLQKVKFRFMGPSIEAVLDRLPTAEAEVDEEGGYIVNAEVFGDGIDMWLRSQGDYVDRII